MTKGLVERLQYEPFGNGSMQLEIAHLEFVTGGLYQTGTGVGMERRFDLAIRGADTKNDVPIALGDLAEEQGHVIDPRVLDGAAQMMVPGAAHFPDVSAAENTTTPTTPFALKYPHCSQHFDMICSGLHNR